MEKLRHEISRMVDNVPVPNQKLDDTVQTALIKAKKQEKRSFFKKQNLIASVASVFVVAFGILLLNTDQETASGDNIGNTSILYEQGDVGLKRMVTEGHTQEIGMEVEDQGFKVILEESYADNHQMAISFRMEAEDTLESLPEQMQIAHELFVDGKAQGKWISFFHTKELSKGDWFTFDYTKNIEADSELKLQITEINGVQGDWSFSFDAEKQTEYLVLKDIPGKEDDLGNSFEVRNVELTPTTLKINANTDVLVDKSVSGSKDFYIEVIGIGLDGEMYLPESVRISSYVNPKINTTRIERFYDTIEVSRGVNVYSYKIIPYIVTYQGVEVKDEHGEGFIAYEHTTPFKEGEIIGSKSEFKVDNIMQEKDATIVTYKANASIPNFPAIINREKDESVYAVSFKNIGDKVEVTYPKVAVDSKTKFRLYEASYQVFPELETQIDLK